ncbi:MAG: cupredoxin domain-containing protein [Armatimonadota bacterium]
MRLRAIVITGLLLVLPAPVGAQGPQIVRVEMTEFAFRPATIRLAAGRPARLISLNRGQIAHQFETSLLQRAAARIIDEAIHVETNGIAFVRLEPGTSALLEFLPRERGRFAFACTIEGHREAGMRGLLDVR